MTIYSYAPLEGVHNPHNPAEDRSIIVQNEDTRHSYDCRYCGAPTNSYPTVYAGEKHEAGCPIRPYVERLEAEASGQPSLLQVLEATP